MAIYSAVPPPPEYSPPPEYTPSPHQPQQQRRHASATLPSSPPVPGIDIDAWTLSALQSLSVSPVARGTGTPLAIPIDDDEKPPATNTGHKTTTVRIAAGAAVDTDTPRRPPSRRDSLKKRDALLKGKEGSRQRRRWENDRLMHVPNVQPPQPIDWEVHPTHTIHHGLPYNLAQFWDRGVRQRVEDKTARLAAQRKAQQLKTGSATGLGAGEVSRDLRETAKRAPAVKSWVRVLEEPVRQFLRSSQKAAEAEAKDENSDGSLASAEGGDKQAALEADDTSSDEEEEKIVFAGRKSAVTGSKAQRQRSGWKMAHREIDEQTVDQGMVFDSFGDDESAAFKRWITHSISDYYGLESTSVVMTNPSRKVVYVRFKQTHQKETHSFKKFPRPLWEMC